MDGTRGRRVSNVHQRRVSASPERVGELLDSLSGPEDRLWPLQRWPPMRLGGPLRVGVAGGHGPIRYRVEEYEPGARVVFRFTEPKGFHGTHGFEVASEQGGALLRHRIDMRLTGMERFTWPLVFGPLHDALIEDCLDRAEAMLGGEAPPDPEWSLPVRALRGILRLVRMRRPRRGGGRVAL